jgi:hypothetical protein
VESNTHLHIEELHVQFVLGTSELLQPQCLELQAELLDTKIKYFLPQFRGGIDLVGGFTFGIEENLSDLLVAISLRKESQESVNRLLNAKGTAGWNPTLAAMDAPVSLSVSIIFVRAASAKRRAC